MSDFIDFTANGQHLDTVDEQQAHQLDGSNPNIAAGVGDYNHENHIGDEAEDADTDEVARIGAHLDGQAG
jgi:hypothetical protein